MKKPRTLSEEYITKKLTEAKAHERRGDLDQRNAVGWYLLNNAPKVTYGDNTVETWFNRPERSYVTQTKDAAGSQIGESNYSGNRADASAYHLFALWELFFI